VPTPAPTPRFVAFEGIDGSGKSTALRHAADALRRRGERVWATREETDGPTGELVRRSIAEHWPPVATAFQFLADRARHAHEIEARLAAGERVLCDRFLHSTLAYQAVTLAGVLPEPRAWLRGLHDGWCPMPDRVVLFNSDPAKAVSRIAARGAATAYEKAAFLGKVRAEYLALAREEPERFVVLDADAPMGVLAQRALAALD
jgi:dTMP kinase